MIFTQLQYLFFFALVFTLHWTLPRRARVPLLFGASLLFYGSWNMRYLALLVGSICVSYVAARGCDAARSKRARNVWLGVAVVGNLSVLAVFKYADFFADNVAALLGALGLNADIPTLHIILPIGISFYIFQAISYVVDVWSKAYPAERNFVRFGTYVAFFPQLVAGPIVRADELLPQLAEGPPLSTDKLRRGARMFIWGAVKKVIFADLVAFKCVDVIFANPGLYDAPTLWLGALGFALQVYADFSGYTDMARGSALMLGYELPENFRLPYLSPHFPEFWNRWHMTLGRWLRDYLYFPLEIRTHRRWTKERKAKGLKGPRTAPMWRRVRNVMIVFTLCGLWHGAAWQFVLFGVAHGAAVAGHLWWTTKFDGPEWKARRERAGYRAGSIALTFFTLLMTFVLFRAESMADAGVYYARMFTATSGERLLHLVPVVLIPLFTAGTLFAARVDLERLYQRVPWPLRSVGYAAVVVGLLMLAPANDLAFVYFQF